MSNKTELLQKIKALADRGVEGERESAQAILSRLMEQYGISEAELEEDRRETAWFAYSQEIERRLLAQIIYMVTGASSYGCVGTYTGRKRKKLGAECTAAERMEIEANYEFFKAAMSEELEIFFSAFAYKKQPFPARRKMPEEENRRADRRGTRPRYEGWLNDGGHGAAHATQGDHRGRHRIIQRRNSRERSYSTGHNAPPSVATHVQRTATPACVRSCRERRKVCVADRSGHCPIRAGAPFRLRATRL